MVDKISAIRFLIEDCYKNFPELIEEIPKEEMYKILENNISSIEVEEESEDYDGLYNVSEKTISLVNKNQGIGIEDIKKEQDIVETLAHEGIHALFRKNESDTRDLYKKKKSKYKRFCKIYKSKIQIFKVDIKTYKRFNKSARRLGR